MGHIVITTASVWVESNITYVIARDMHRSMLQLQFGGEVTSQSILMASWKTVRSMFVRTVTWILVLTVGKRPKGKDGGNDGLWLLLPGCSTSLSLWGSVLTKSLEFIRQCFVRLNICWSHLANRRFQMPHAYFFCFKTLLID